MSKSTISTFQVFEMFPDAELRGCSLSRVSGRRRDLSDLQNNENITTRKGGYYRCNPCKLDFTIRTGTILNAPTSR